jgi:hypothetical protein
VEHDAVAGDFDEFVEIERWAPDECGAAGSRAETAFTKQPIGPLDAGRGGFDWRWLPAAVEATPTLYDDVDVQRFLSGLYTGYDHELALAATATFQ